MQIYTLLSRRNVAPEAKTDFRPDDLGGSSPFAQLRRLSSYRAADVAGVGDIEDCDEAIEYLREYTYRKIFTGTSHEEYLQTDKTAPHAIDWLIATHETESANFKRDRK
jgi:hypothetical protein